MGSSPRGRGKRHCVGDRARRLRLIPAWAGKTPRRFPLHSPRRAHPRVGGENSVTFADSVTVAGSSPRGRGKPHCREAGASRCGLIPAWAGKTQMRASLPLSRGAHPRVGGENQERVTATRIVAGSSPRGRGKPVHECLHRRRERLIPAWAGKTARRAHLHDLGAAHPRVGGENDALSRPRAVSLGSSPRGRGKRSRG
mgnify:FL=1